jgi:phosphoglycolate phosphatase-like HAD superfamily hydrolase
VARETHPLLLLFDIDGTLLLRAFVEHRDALDAAIRRVYGVAIPDGRIEAAGRTDVAIARSILTLAGVGDDHISGRLDDLRAVACDEYANRCPADLHDRVAPGVSELMAALAARDDVRLSLLTGNLEPIGRLKLTRAGLGRYFARGQGGFGSDHEDRAALPAIARRRAGAAHRPWPRERTVVIGDTPRDIACARADGAHCIAVATGPFRADELTGADAVVAGAGEMLPALDALAAPG